MLPHPEAHLATHYPAEFLDGWSMAVREVTVSLDRAQLVVFAEAGRTLATWPLEGLTVDALQDGGVVHVSHASAPHETLVVRDPVLASALTASASRVEALPGGRHPLLFAWACLVAVVALAAGAWWSTPTVARLIAARIPLETERGLGGQIELLLDFSTCRDVRAEQTLHGLVTRLSGSEARRYEVRIVESAQPNAFALPGGVILVTDTLLEQAEDGDEIAGVLAHEIEHVARRHVLSAFVRDAMLSGLWSLTVGDYAGLLLIDPSTAYQIANLEFSRDDEADADAGAVARLHEAGLSHHGLRRFFARLAEKYDDEGVSWLSTHPATKARMGALDALADVADPSPALTEAALSELRAACARGERARELEGADDGTDP